MRELTPEVAAALERLRSGTAYKDLHDDEEYYYSQAQANDEVTVIDLVMENFPPGHTDEITPERLVACGFTPYGPDLRAPSPSLITYCQSMNPPRWYCASQVHSQIAPRNMGEVWELLDWLGIYWRTKGGV